MTELFEKRRTLAAAVHGGLTARDEPDAAELERRAKIKDELLRCIELVDRGLFAAAIITEKRADKWPEEYVTQMYGEREVIQAAAGQIVMHYGKQHTKEGSETLTVDAGELLGS